MTADDSRRARLRTAWERAWDHGDVDALDDVLDESYRRRDSRDADGQDRAGFKAGILAVRQAFPDLTTTIDELVLEGDRAAILWRSSGTHQGSLLGVPATRRRVEVSGATFARFEGDRIVEEVVTWDPRALLSALGIIDVGKDE